MKNKLTDKIKKHLAACIAIALIIISGGVSYATLNSQQADHGINPINGYDPMKLQVLKTGNDYTLNKQQENDYILQKKENEKNAKKDPTTKPVTPNIPGALHYPGIGSTSMKKPLVTTNFKDSKDEKKTWEKGDSLKFYVTAREYPYGTKNVLVEKNFKVTLNGKEVQSTGGSDEKPFYTITLDKGTNKVEITATDSKKRTTTVKYEVNAERKKVGTATILVEADSSSLGFSKKYNSVTVYDDSTVQNLIEDTIGSSKVKFTDGSLVSVTGTLAETYSKELENNWGSIEDLMKSVYIEKYPDDPAVENTEQYNAWKNSVIAAAKAKMGDCSPFGSDGENPTSYSIWTVDGSGEGEALNGATITLTFTLYSGLTN